MNMEARYYIYQNNKTVGPFAESVISRKLINNEISGDTQVCTEGNQNWIRIKDILSIQRRVDMMKNSSFTIDCDNDDESTSEEGVRPTAMPGIECSDEGFSLVGRDKTWVFFRVLAILLFVCSALFAVCLLCALGEGETNKRMTKFLSASGFFIALISSFVSGFLSLSLSTILIFIKSYSLEKTNK